jgi:hypothetical protein
MKLPFRVSVLFFIGIFAAGSTALGYFYYFVYSPPLKAADHFMNAMEHRDVEALRQGVIISYGPDNAELREPEDKELQELLDDHFKRGRILDQRRQEGNTRDFYDLVYREPDGRVYKLLITEVVGRFRVVVPERSMSDRHRYLWDYSWTN